MHGSYDGYGNIGVRGYRGRYSGYCRCNGDVLQHHHHDPVSNRDRGCIRSNSNGRYPGMEVWPQAVRYAGKIIAPQSESWRGQAFRTLFLCEGSLFMQINYLKKNSFLQTWGKKLLICALVTIYMSVSMVPRRAEANPVVVAAGAVEIGTLAFWGGTVLVASLGVAVGMDKSLADDIKDFGKSAWTGANDAIKSSISWSVSKMSFGSSTATKKTTYAVEFTPEVKAYLSSSYDSYFRTSETRPKIAINTSTQMVTKATAVVTHKAITALYGHWLGNTSYNIWGGDSILTAVENVGTNLWTVWAARPGTFPYNARSKGITYTIPTSSVATVLETLVARGEVTLAPDYLDNSTWTIPATTYPDVIVPGAIPVGMPDVFTMPAPSGVIDPAGNVDYDMPAIGYPDAVIPANPANPWDVAIGNPAIPGQVVKDLSRTDTITANPDVAVPDTAVSNPPIDWSDTPSDSLNFGPLRIAGNLFTTKFPFSIPWDIERQFNIFNVTPKAPILHVDKTIPIFNTSMKLKFNIDFTIMEPAAIVVRWFMIIAFDLGMILSMRKFMPE